MEKVNMFVLTRSNFENALKNFELFQKQNEKTVSLFLEQMKQENKKLKANFTEWIETTNKAFDDYRDIIIKGLDYLSDYLEKNNHNSDETVSRPTKSMQNANIVSSTEAASLTAKREEKADSQNQIAPPP